MKRNLLWYLSIIFVVLTACSVENTPPPTEESGLNSLGETMVDGQRQEEESWQALSWEAEEFLPKRTDPAVDCPSDFWAGQYVYPTEETPLYFIDASLADQALTTLFTDEPVYLIEHIGCFEGNPVWEAESLMTGLRGTILESVSGRMLIGLSTNHTPDQIPRTMLNIASYCRMNVGGASYAGIDAQGNWWCGGSQGVGLIEPVDMDAVCHYTYGSRPASDGRIQIFRMFSYQEDISDENSWTCLSYPPPDVDNDGYISGGSAPYSDRYVYVPSPVRPGSISVHIEPDERSSSFGVLENLQYYELFSIAREWTAIRTPRGVVGWINSPLVVVGNNVSTNNINIQRLLNDPDTAVNVYSGGELPNRYEEAHDYMVDELGRDTGNAASLAWFAVEAASGRTNAVDMLCTLVDTTVDYQQISAGEELSIACVGISLGQGALTLVQGGTPVGAYITVSELVLENLGPFIRYNDRLWMDEMNQQAGSCFFTTLFIGEDNACRR